jgi:hypothetical protein
VKRYSIFFGVAKDFVRPTSLGVQPRHSLFEPPEAGMPQDEKASDEETDETDQEKDDVLHSEVVEVVV